MNPHVAVLLTLAVSLPALIPATQSVGWKQFGGPRRNFTVDVKGLASSWPTTGPRQLWKRELGEGFSAIAVEGGRLYTMYQRGEQEVVIAMNATDGSTVWEQAYTAPITVNMS